MPEIKRYFLRRQYKDEATKGFLIDPDFVNEDGELEARLICQTLERPNLENKKDDLRTPENESSCIPEGIYICKKYSSKDFLDTWEVTSVKNRSKILFHKANYVTELLGCIAVCMQVLDQNPKNDPKFDPAKKWLASQSRDAFELFKKVMPEKFELRIISDDNLCKVA